MSDRLSHPGPRRFLGWPGFGKVPANASVRGLADLASEVTAQIVGPVELFAQSMGGVIAVLATLAKPALVKHLVLSVTSGGIDTASLGAIDWRGEFRKNNPDVPRWFEEERWDLAARLREVTVPVLLLWGDADPLSPVAVGRRLKELLPDAELVVFPGGDHDLASQRADDVVPYVERHLAKLPSNGSDTPA